jgi:glycosyltransferase involved in cell wall biosynthesis
MRIGVDATCWANPRGYGRFTRELIPVMAALAPQDRFVCFVDPRAAGCFDLRAPNVEMRVVAQRQSPTIAASAEARRSVPDMLRLTAAVAHAKLDAFFSPSVYTYFPLPPGTRGLVTIHDAIADRFPELTLPDWRARLFWRLKVSLALWQTQLVLTVSDFAAADIARVLGVNPSRIRVALEAPADAYRRAASPQDVARAAETHGLPTDVGWFVYVGGLNPHKNVDLLVRAHASVARTLGPAAPHLAFVGPTAEDVFLGEGERIHQTIATEGTAPLVHWLGFLPDDQLRLIHAGALALAIPSACEGFGLPAVEAAACGTPVVATTESPLPQLLAGGGLFVAPGDLDGLVQALSRMATDEGLRARMGAEARSRAAALTWERGARATLDALHELT